MTRIGSLFSGYGGLDLGVQAVIGGTVAWHVEYDAAPSKILAYHWPDVPNYGDVTAVNWSSVEPVDVLTGGFPCQDVSLAGARAGLMDGTRSGLWSEYAKAIDVLRPSLVVIENVRGLLSARTMEEVDAADSDLEWEPSGVGVSAGVDRPVLNAFGRVLGDLAELGYVGRWVGVRAADAGAPHGRFRVFIVANRSGFGWGEGWPESAGGVGGSEVEFSGSGLADPTGARRAGREDTGTGRGNAGAGARGIEPERGGLRIAQDADLATGSERRLSAPGEAEGGRARPDAGGRDRASAADAERDGGERRGGHGDVAGSAGAGEGEGDQRERHGDAPDDHGTADREWGPFAPAIERWELTLGRSAPTPTRPDGRDEGQRLNPEFVEWMMGLPAGHVTDPAIGLTRNQQLKALGNGVVPQQASLAVSLLLSAEAVAA